jgi:hypothetical protein
MIVHINSAERETTGVTEREEVTWMLDDPKKMVTNKTNKHVRL